VNNVYLYNDTQATWSGVQYLLRIKTPAGRGAVQIANVWFEDVSGTGSKNDVLLTNAYTSATVAGSSALGTPTFSNINVVNVQGGGTSSCTTPLATKVGSNITGGGC
jgi:hypothetical protein